MEKRILRVNLCAQEAEKCDISLLAGHISSAEPNQNGNEAVMVINVAGITSSIFRIDKSNSWGRSLKKKAVLP